ncbi:MAG TPA: hypothetical protein EYP30_06120 [Archaeoglobaceae archaeon]|nr:hypothetical protein [Archaeoglobaceae archaeon]
MEFPVHESLKVIRGTTIFKTDDWWKAIILAEGYKGKEVSIYLWKKKGDSWKRQQKYTVRRKKDWEFDKKFMNEFVKELE